MQLAYVINKRENVYSQELKQLHNKNKRISTNQRKYRGNVIQGTAMQGNKQIKK